MCNCNGTCNCTVLPKFNEPSIDRDYLPSCHANPEHYPLAQKAIKTHGGKPRLDLLPREALIAMATGFEHGSHKDGRTEWDWLKGTYWSLYIGSLLRHAYAVASGEMIDPEDGVSHLGKIMANAAILETYRVRDIGKNDIMGRE